MEKTEQIREALHELSGECSEQFKEEWIEKVSNLLDLVDAKYSEKEMELYDAEQLTEEEKLDHENTHNKWCDSLIDPKTVYDQEKGEIVKRMYDQLNLEQLTGLENWLAKNKKLDLTDIRYES